MPERRKIYSTYSGTQNTTTSTTDITAASLDFTPSSNGANIAIFYSGLLEGSGITHSSIINLKVSSNANQALFFSEIKMKDSSDVVPISSFAILPNVANNIATTVNVYYRSGNAAHTAKIRDVHITAIELSANDVFDTDIDLVTQTVAWVTQASIVTGAGKWGIFASAAHSDTDASTVPYDRAHVRVLDVEGNDIYGYSGETRALGSGYQPYHYVSCHNKSTSNTWNLQSGRDDSTTGSIVYRNLLALKLDDIPQTGINHGEAMSTSTSTTFADALSMTYTANLSSDVFVSATWVTAGSSTATSVRHRVTLGGTNILGVEAIQEPAAAGIGSFNGGNSLNWGGVNGVVSVTAGSTTVALQHAVETSGTVYTGRKNIIVITPESAFGMNMYSAGWKLANRVSVKSAGAWKEATSIYVNDGGAWKESLGQIGYVSGSYVDAVSDDTDDPTATPTPAPVSPPPPGTCFIAGSTISMADGSFKNIEDVLIGDMVLGRWGANEVLGYDRPLLGARPMWNINDEVFNTSDHLTWTDNGWAVILKDTYLSNDYKQKLFVIQNHMTGDGQMMEYVGVHPSNVSEFGLGHYLAYNTVFKEVTKLEPVKLPESTQLYALVTDGDHTIHVNGYVFSGWANDEDYNYHEKIGT